MTRALALVLCGALVSMGCASQVGFGRATTIERGKGEVSGIMQLDVVSPRMAAEGDAVNLPWAHVGIGYHRGLASGFELGARGWVFGLPQHLSFGGALDTKIQIVRGEPRRGLSLATGGSIGYHQVQVGGTPWHTFTGWIPVLLGQDFGSHQFVIGPRAGLTLWAGEGQNTIHVPWVGGGAGVSFGVAGRTKIMPEVILVYSPLSFNGAIESEKYGATLVQLGLSAAYEP